MTQVFLCQPVTLKRYLQLNRKKRKALKMTNRRLNAMAQAAVKRTEGQHV
jgi:hypothetical protein